ncbi:hypothetical protein GO613_22080 [Azoarcus communis]|jgi:uncharacterized membrane protein (DUF373 family)|uniref:phosphate-starvation-inducible PsiE family protein n=1 Tax=Parazoarcus communis TaxID=41977 RepID=UPI001459B16C|nr:phosphate-starvation-inducible PsiE family protein [Parazoarcus communis]MBP8169075.1 phosphate-starvation-inducible PsiE family protein [Azonexus sp.]MDX9943741.1 phosphate-starvation-inducible PsiE family protein [Azonexus sp.]NMG50786.1 hypothetical protein [Parazoarcus communis]
MQANENSTHQTKDPVLLFFNRVIAQVSRVLAAIMVMVIIWGVADVVYVLHQRLIAPPFMLLEIKDILATFGAFMAVLIAIEIFHNIILYVEDNHNRQLAVEIVLGTALMAIARKVIVLDFNEVGAGHVYATATVTLALSVGYYLIVIRAQGAKRRMSRSIIPSANG